MPARPNVAAGHASPRSPLGACNSSEIMRSSALVVRSISACRRGANDSIECCAASLVRRSSTHVRAHACTDRTTPMSIRRPCCSSISLTSRAAPNRLLLRVAAVALPQQELQQDSCIAQAASYFASLPMDVGCKTEARLVGSGTLSFRCRKQLTSSVVRTWIQRAIATVPGDCATYRASLPGGRLALLMSRGCNGPASSRPLRSRDICRTIVWRQMTETEIDAALLGNARVGLCLHEHKVQVVPVAKWWRWTGFCFLRISTSFDALNASSFGKLQKPKTARRA